MHEGSRRAIYAAFLANLAIAGAKLAAWVATGAASLLAEAVHSLADTGNQGLLLLGGRRSRRPADRDHPFGYGAERYFWAFVVAIVLFLMGGAFAIAEGVSKLRHPHDIESPGWALAVLVAAIVFEALSLRTALSEARSVRGDAGWWDFIRHAKSPELPVVMLEDMGALLGLLFALAGVGLAQLLGDPRWDALGSAAIGVLLTAIALLLSARMKGLLIGESATARDAEAIAEALATAPAVRRLIHLRTLHLGPDHLLVGAKLELDAALDFAGVARAIDEAERRVRARVPRVDVMYLEPDVHDPARPPQGPPF
jgi:cation diffusion facilitator family transporter